MKVIRLRHPGGIDRLEPGDMADPGEPGPGEILVRLRASSINYHDYVVVTGGISTPDGRIPLSDGAGDVLAVGSGVEEFGVGDVVISTFFPHWLDGAADAHTSDGVPGDRADGYARERVIARATGFTRAPAGIQSCRGGDIALRGAYRMARAGSRGRAEGRDTVLVQGTGGVSIFALQFAKAMGAMVIATSSSDAKLARLTAMGADHVVNYKNEPKWSAAVKAVTGGTGVDHVVEVGGAGTLPQSISAARIGGISH